MADTGEQAEFPILCETCLGDNPYVRMTKEKMGKECKICSKAFTIFRWLPGRGMRYKKTEICPTCAKVKNVCQTCILDLEHGLPVQVRDTALSIQDSVPKEDANRQAYLAKTANSIEVMGEQPDFSGRAQPVGREMLKRMSRKDPYYKRNRPHICSFFVKGQCNRGNECPYRHEMPQGDPELAKQNIVDRYHGTNDPVAKRMLSRANRTDKLSLPEDKSITSLFVMGMDKSITQSDLRDHFYTFGELKSVVVVPKGNCAFINFKTRAAAEAASQAAMGGCVIKGVPLRLAWGKAKPKGPQSEIASKGTGSGETTRESHPTRASIPLPPGAVGSAESEAYPSQDPTVLGSNS